MKKILFLTLLIFFAFTLNAQKILYDNTKSEQAGNADWIPDTDTQYPVPAQSGISGTPLPTTTGTSETYWSGALSYWAVEMVKRGYIIETLPSSGNITYGDGSNPQDLSNYDVFVVCEPNNPFSAAEKTAMLNFVSDGGGLFMIADHPIADRDGDGWDPTEVWNDFLNSIPANGFGMLFNTSDDYTNTPSTNIPNLLGDPLLHGVAGDVEGIEFHGSSTMIINTVDNPSVIPVVFRNGVPLSGTTGIICAYATYGSGRIVGMGDSSIPEDVTPNSGTTYDGFIQPIGGSYDGHNGRLVSNATIWLMGTPVATPTLFVSPSSLSGFTYVEGSGPSSSQSFTLSGSELDGSQVTLTAPTNYEISTDNTNFFASLNISYTAPTLNSTTIYVRLKAGLTAGTYNNETITCDDNGTALNKTVTLNGSVTSSGGACASDLIISEYIEGSSNNKYIEIYNGTGATVDLTDYQILLFANGSATATSTQAMSGTLADGAVVIYENSAEGLGVSGIASAVCNFNGDDAIAIYKISTSSYIDIFGNIGCDPGSAWTDVNTTVNKTLVRNASITNGISVDEPSSCPFNTLATEWTQYDQDVITNLGSHTMTCGCSTPTSQASNVTFSNITSTSMTVNWTRGGTPGDGVIVLAHEAANVDADPVNGSTYSADSYFGNGSEIGTGNFVVFMGSGTSVTVTGLSAGTSYYFKVYEYNCTDVNSMFNTTSPAAGNQTTVATPTITITGTLSDFGYECVGSTTAEQSYSVSGANLTADIIVTAPLGFKVSTVSGGPYSASVTLTQSGGVVNSTTIYTVFQPNAQNTFSENISHSSTGAVLQEQPVTGIGITLPTLTTTAISLITFNSASSGGNITADGGSAVTARGVCWNTSTNPTIANSNTVDGSGIGSYTSSLTGLSGGTTYYVRAYATNACGTAYGDELSFTTLKEEPANHPTSFVCGSTTSTSIPLTWTDAIGTPLPDGYLIKWSSVGYANIVAPVDGVAEADGLEVKNIANGIQTYTATGLSSSTIYYFKIWSYTNSGTDINYKLDGTIQQTSCNTISACASELIISEYCEGSGNNKYLEIYNATGADITLTETYRIGMISNGGSWTEANIALTGTVVNNDVFIIANNLANATILADADQTSGSLTFNGDDAVALQKYNGSTWENIDIIGTDGADPGTGWDVAGVTNATADHTLIRKNVITAPQTNWATSAGTDAASSEWIVNSIDDFSDIGVHTMACTCEEPTVQSSNLTFTSVTDVSMILNWTSGNGVSRIVVAKENSPVDWTPIDGNTYSANSSFGSGTELGTGNYVIYNGSGNNVTVTNLTPGTTYYFKIFEYGCTPGTEDYLTSGTPEEGYETTKPNNVSDLTVVCATASSMEVSWTLPTGNYDAILVTVDQGETPATPSCDGSGLTNPITNYSGADVYCTNANASVYVFNNIGTNVSISGLSSGLSYTIKVFVYINSSWSDGVSITKTAEVSDVTNLQANCGNTTSQVGWNNPNSACFDEILIVASDVSITATPAGDGSGYTANSIYGSGTDIGTNEFVVYKGTGELVDITGLTNNTTYYFKAFVRDGTDWSAGIEVSCMPSTAVVLNYGDLAIVGINTDITGVDPRKDEIQFVCFVDITTGTSIDFTDNGYERLYAGLWADSEGTLRFTRTGADIPAGTVVTIQGASNTATPLLGTDYDVFVCGVNDNANWSVASLNNDGAAGGPYDLNVNDQIWMMQGGTWNNGGTNGNHDATYSGNVLYGWTAIGWEPAPGYDDTKGSTVFPGSECATTNVAGKVNPDKVRYTGTTTVTSQIGWIGRFNDPGNWTDYADNPSYFAGGSLPCVISINYDVVATKWTGVTNTDWDNCANWNSLRVPDANTDVEFDNISCFNDIVIKVGETAVCRNLTINGGVASYYIKLEGDATKVLDIRGDLTINAVALDLDDANAGTTDGTIKLYGDWINNLGTGGFIEGNSTVEFVGTTAQYINTVDASEVFANLTINNNSAEGVLLNKSIQTNGNLLLNSGLLNLNGFDLTINGQYSRNSGSFAGNVASTINVINTGSIAPFYFATPQNLDLFYMNRASVTAELATNLSMTDLTIDAGTVQLNSGKFFTVSNTITNNVGTSGLLIKSDANGTASLIHYTEGVEATSERYIAGGVWGYIFPPLSAVQENTFGGANPNFYYYNEAPADYWDATSIYEPMGWTDVPSGALATTRGYIVYHPSTQTYVQTGGNLYFDATNRNKVFTTTYNDSGTGAVNLNGVTSDWDDFEGWNLFGNPYTSAFDWTQVTLSNVEDVVYYYDGEAANYKYYGTGTNYNQGITVNGGSQYVPANQGFFVKSTLNGGTVTIPDAARVHNSQDFWKGANEYNSFSDIVRLKIDFNGYFDETVVKLDSNATEYHDNFDGYKMFSPVKTVPQIFTIDIKNSNYSVNFTPFEPVKMVPVGLFVQNEGQYSICTSEISTTNHHVYLKDNETNITTNLLNDTLYSFNFAGGVDYDRFELWFNQNTAPYSVLPLSNQILYVNETLNYQLPNSFTDADLGDYLTITVSLSDDNELPEWLSFDGKTFKGTPAEPQEIFVKVTATDRFGASVYQIFKITVLETVAFEDVANTEFLVYPNPATNVITVESNKLDVESIRIIDVSGKTVFKTNATGVKTNIDVSGLTKGIYFIEIKDNTRVETQKLIIY